ncbi:2,3-diketo-5-methylthio-1-phosphopentane phosphatase [Rhizophagus irregularis]|uniref:2,3-diketo-5-methylthio-1-phosphopentane phosphatase n=2 Tax=Rhizophagus irregularis TaxID=588596 RepID=A0A2I1EHZ3_9GLOM|nr:enolase-phosphatase 1 [Rhizophagus irregularis DAOM 181602=DAOM 197198]PKC66037.1 2,3-diketo-5-methylthio-1-phosphopentane phosphatase [Rhizophagus irregularis]PKY21732.1 2,3-diketo-5-methylthio-1-phosphopentane phosphatase [Rhizophagus irregularis]POG72397.1 enolase-phosphatase 1 [Rhizophagus irregularis DAOM 181602=DAOM 197198]|eukprot:XP_025179263.1 enolase-phosphatase 1 [Rhizophagus irregularis DAOM 181602=DAOM 197198]
MPITPTYKCVLLDIEGTTTPISFVHDRLFSYVKNNLLQEQIQLLREQAMKDVNNNLSDVILVPEVQQQGKKTNEEEIKKAIIQNIQWQMKINRKIGAFKSFQGFMWESGYESGELKGEIFDDVLDALKKWKESGIKIYIYSSGSISAQKSLFKNSDKGDLTEYIDGYFDTSIGSKIEKSSYVNIAKEIQLEPRDILFLSDNVKEIISAKSVCYQAAIIERKNNMPLSDDDRKNNIIFTDFLQIFSYLFL